YRGLVAGETAAVLGGELTLTTAAAVDSPAGAYSIVPSGLSSSNYTIRFVDGTLMVTPAAPALTLALPSAAERQRDARLVDRPAIRFGAPSAECAPPTPNERICTGWPVCVAERPVCQTRTVEPGR
ncbi:MAG: MBG domain-containing protein, partial [Caldimonas sp.]